MLDWWKRLSRVGKVAGIVGAISGAIVGVAAAWPLVEWIAPAHRGFVEWKVGGVQTTTNELLLWKSEDTKAKIEADIAGWSIQSQKEQDPQTKSLMNRQIEQLKASQQQIDDRIKKLKGQ